MDGRRVLLMETIQSNAIKTLFEVLKEIVHDVNLKVDTKGVTLRAFDGAKCALVHMHLRAEGFERFECDNPPERPLVIGMNMSNVFRLLKTADKNDTITLFVDACQSNELGILIQNAEKNTRTQYWYPMIELDDEKFDVQDVEFDNIIAMQSAFFQKICRDMANIGSVVSMRSDGNELVLRCAGDFAKQQTVIGEADAGVMVSKKDTKVVEGRFDLKYLLLFCKAANLCNTIELLLKDEYPLIMKFNVASLGELRFLVACRIDDD